MNKPEKVMTVKEVQNNWNDMATIYHEFDSAPQSFYFAIVSMLQMQKAKAVLEVGCGRCVLVPYALDLLNSNAIYFATDLAPKMIELAESRLKGTLQRFSSSLSFQQWCKKNNFTLKVANGEEIIQPNIKFDRIICNMVMMLTEDPQKMLKSFYQQAQQGCLLGVSVWGQKELNTFHEQIERIAAELKVQKPVKSRSNFHLYNKVPELAQKEGWKLVVKWDQVSSFPYLNVKDFEWYAQSMSSKMTYLSEQQRKWVYDQYMRRQTQRLQVKKQAFLFPAQISIYRK